MTPPRIASALALLVAALIISGCHTDQVAQINLYRSVVKIPGDERPFEPNQPLSLQGAFLLANGLNERVSIAGEQYLQAIIDRKRAVANFLPTASLDASYAQTAGNDLPAGTGSHQRNASVSANMNVFNGGSDIANLNVKDLTIRQQKDLLLDAQESLLVDVALVYYQVLRAEESVVVLRNSLKVQEERVRDMQARQTAGLARPLDVYQTEAIAAGTRVQLTDALNQVVSGRALLAYLLSASVQSCILSDGYPLPTAVPDLAALRDIAANNRKDYLAAQAAAMAARQQVEVAFGQYYPSVAVDFTRFLDQHPAEGPDWTSFIALHMPLFSAGRIEADVEQAWSQYRQADLTRQQLARRVQQDVEISNQNYVASNTRLTELRTQVKAADEAFKQADSSYNVGLATNLERLSAQDQMLSAQLSLASETYNNKLFYLNILRSTGRLRTDVLPPASSGGTLRNI
jgi:outer membrane protein